VASWSFKKALDLAATFKVHKVSEREKEKETRTLKTQIRISDLGIIPFLLSRCEDADFSQGHGK
jgi:hypothetical protein